MTTGAVFAQALIAAAAALVVLFAVTFAAGVRTGKHTVIDVAWGSGIAVAGLAGFLATLGHGDGPRRWLLLAATVVWGCRLAVHVAVRLRGAGEDPRYRDLLGRAPRGRNRYALRIVYLPQVLVMLVATVPVVAGMAQPAPAGAVTAAGAAVWLFGFGFEATGDWQLARFRADPANHGHLMDRGLWRYTRHPNYFGDAAMWWGLFLISYATPIQLVTVVSPLLMTFVLTRGTGQRMTDARMARSHPDYAEYAARTSTFIPWRPRASRPASLPAVKSAGSSPWRRGAVSPARPGRGRPARPGHRRQRRPA
jgi:steroid 5-alpha reductase family enzyme